MEMSLVPDFRPPDLAPSRIFLRIHRPTYAVRLCFEEVALRSGDEERGHVPAAEAAVGRADRRHWMRLQHAAGG